MGIIKCYCLMTKEGELHCPLVTDAKELEHTFNHFVRGEDIVQVDIEENFVCQEERQAMCGACPFA